MPKYLIWGYNPRNESDHFQKDLYGNVFTRAEANRILSTLKYDGVRYHDYCIEDNWSGRTVKKTCSIKLNKGPS
jgi:hypothetical protein